MTGTTEMLVEVYGNTSMTKESELAILNERLVRIETQLTEIHEIFCKLYQAYVDMTSSPMFTALVGKMGK